MNKNITKVAALLVPVLLVGACSSKATVSASASSSSTTAATTGATPAAALIHQLQQIVDGDYAAVCQQMESVAAAMPTPTSIPTSACITTLTALHQNFATDGLTTKSTFTVDPVKATGDSATISGTNIHVDGSTLTALMVAHSTGVQSGQLDISFQESLISGAWYVTNMNLNVG